MAALSFDQLFRLAVLHGRVNTDTETKKNHDSESLEICCPLPFYLQDLCLLVIINELDCYPTELLASLPYWLRYRILNNVPALDLARLEHTPVASGVNTDEIWKSRVKADDPQAHYKSTVIHGLGDANNIETPNKGSPFQLNVSRDRNLYSSLHRNYYGRNSLIMDIIKDLGGTEDLEFSTGSHRLLEIASDLLTTSYNTDLEKATRQLVSIPGNLVLSNLLVGSLHQDCQNPHCSQEVWKKQAVTLVVKDFNTRSYAYYSYNHRPQSDIHLIPHRLLPFCDKPDPVELLSILSNDCQLHPHGVNVHIGTISQSFSSSLRTERLALDDGGLSLPTEGAKCTSILNSFLENVVSLRLQCDKYGQIGLLVSMIKAAIPGGRLKHLMCALPDLYMDVIDPLSTLFSMPTFQMLSLELSDAYPLMFSKLLRAFVTAPCPHVHKLLFHIKGGSQFQMSLKENQIASMDMQGLTLPSCSLQHKVLKFTSGDDLAKALYLLLQYPTIRLKKLTLFTNNAYFHLCAIHPDLQVTKLALTIVGGSHYVRRRNQQTQQVATLQQDIVSFFKITSLEKVCIQGCWGPMTEVKLGLVFGLQVRSHMRPLKKLALELDSPTSYKIREFAMLCDAVFSLPQLENLQLVLGKGFASMLRNRRFEDEMYKSWNKKGGGIRLKSISLQAHAEKEFKKVKLIPHTLSFSTSKLSPNYHEYYDFSDDDDYHYSDFYHYSDYYYGYDPWQCFNYDSDEYSP